jgi:hypothetical protein
MSARTPDEELPEEKRLEIFRALVAAEDLQEMSRPQARRLIAQRFHLSEAEVSRIEREGTERLWAAP